ncbi:AraC family transcriptional regulator [Dysgonomonas sp. 520]|uniref:helix-turn-helix domain-containing protein n=1 Tax=Dysgonomonas sp. 520 TaxID=2302931 RepID=UPI0013CFFB80|nr:AraC family transcriptional regulator [Dysgonomonas sp. 520]NDW10040.1 AraC family transcriptional regulator [Dysgonomonas sp. 520]
MEIPDIKQNKNIEYIPLNNGGQYNSLSGKTRILFVMEGAVYAESSYFHDSLVCERMMFILPEESDICLQAKGDVSIIIIHTENIIKWSKCFSPEEKNSLRIKDGYRMKPGFICLDIIEVVYDYLKTLQAYISFDVVSAKLEEIKLREFFLILSKLYPAEQLHSFLNMYMISDFYFTEQIRINYRKARNIQQLAHLVNFSYSGFNKKFKKVFGTPAYSWMQKRKAEDVYNELSKSSKSIKEISTDFNFISLSHFNEFCHKMFGQSPRQVRKQQTNG